MTSGRRIIFVNRYFFPDISATAQLLSDLAFHLAEKEWSVTVVTSRQSYEGGESKYPASESVRGVTIVRVPTTHFGRRRLLGRSSDYVTFFLSSLFVLLRIVGRDSVVVSLTDPPLISVAGWLAAKVKGGVAVNWIHDLFPEVAERLGVIKEGRIAASIARWLRDLSLSSSRASVGGREGRGTSRIAHEEDFASRSHGHQSALNVVVGEGMAASLRARGIHAELQPNWAPFEATAEEPSAFQSAAPFVVGYSGNLGRAHEPETLIGAIRQLSSDRSISFLMTGGGAGFETIRSIVAREGLTNVLMESYVARERVIDSLRRSHIHVVSLRPEVEGLIVPSKVYGALAAARPIIFIGAAGGDVSTLLASHQCGWTVNPGDSAALADRILALASDRAAWHRASEAAVKAHEEHFSRERALATFKNFLESAMKA